MAERRFIRNIELENAKIFWRNFRGRASEYNAEGQRNFCVVIPEDMVDDLLDEGWNIKRSKAYEGEEPDAYLKVNVRYSDYSVPKIYRCTKKNRVPLDEEAVGSLDECEIENVDLVIRPYEYKPGKVSAYVKEMYVTIVQSRFEEKYDDMYETDYDNPPF